MATPTTRLGILKFDGADLLKREAFNDNYDILDLAVPTRNESLLMARTRIDNPVFGFWQRGVGPFSGTLSGVVGPDRWIVRTQGTSSLVVTQEGGQYDPLAGSHLSAKAVYTHNQESYLSQAIDQGFVWENRGAPVSLILRAMTNTANSVRVLTVRDGVVDSWLSWVPATGTWQTVQVNNIVLGGVANTLEIRISFEASCTAYIGAIAIVPGAVAPDRVTGDPLLDKLKCLNHYQLFKGGAQEVIGSGLAISTTQARFYLPFLIPMNNSPRPVIVFNNPTGFAVKAANDTNIACTSLTGAVGSVNGANILANVASGLVAGNGTLLIVSDPASYLEAATGL